MLKADIEAEVIAEILAGIRVEIEAECKTKPILGFTDSETVKIDCDNMSFKAVKYWASRTLKRFRLRGYIILKSSEKHYHVIFNRKVSWEKNLCVVGWVAICSRNGELLKWLAMQCIKESSTLRVGAKGDKASPRVVFRNGKQDGKISDFLRERKIIKQIDNRIH